MCYNCGYTPCRCSSGNYHYNWYNTDNYSCNPCTTQPVCKKKIPAACVFYGGPKLTGVNIETNTQIEFILIALDNAIAELKLQVNQTIQNQNNIINDLQGAVNGLSAQLDAIVG